MFNSFARAGARASRAATGRSNFVRAMGTSAARRAAAVGTSGLVLTAGALGGTSLCLWGFFEGKKDVDYEAVYRDVAAM